MRISSSRGVRMAATEFEYRHRFWMIVGVYLVAYAFYNVRNLNVLYALLPWNQGVVSRDLLVRILYAGAALVAAVGALLLTWSIAYRPSVTDPKRTAFSIAGPFRYVRNPQYLAYFLLLLALGTFQSVIGFPVLLVGELILLLRLIGREELRLEQQYGERFVRYAERVPRLLPALRPRIEGDGQAPRWGRALWEQAFQWGFVATLLAFAFTLSDPIGYAFGGATFVFLLLQMLAEMVWSRLHRTPSPSA
jgi:protein-S-isoprenylcysteine O-methyltransferase Ste14